MRETGIGIALFAAYALAGIACLRLAIVHPSASAVWAPTGIAIASLVLAGIRFWPAIFAGALVVSATTGAAIPTAVGIAAGNSAEAAAAAFLIGRFAGGARAFDRASTVFRYTAFVGAATVLSAAVGVGSLWAAGAARAKDVPLIATTWWLGDLSGALVVVPAIVLWVVPHPPPDRGRAETAAFVLASLAVAVLLFVGPLSPLAERRLPLHFLSMPILLWAAFRFGSRGTASVVLFFSAVAVGATIRHEGPFGGLPPAQAFAILQAFMGVISVTTLVVASLVAERAEAARVRDQFLSIAGHELRNPLGALVLHVENLSRTAASPGLDEVRTRIVPIRRSVDRIVNLVYELLSADRLAAGTWPVRPRSVDLAEFVRGATEGFVERQGLPSDWAEVRAEAAVPCRTDPERFEYVFLNLLSNAAKYGLGRPVHVSISRRGPFVDLAVRDQGLGIPPEDRDRIFERFERGSSSGDSGFGLGLWIARETVTALGGRIWVDSRPGEGSTFFVELPAEPQSV